MDEVTIKKVKNKIGVITGFCIALIIVNLLCPFGIKLACSRSSGFFGVTLGFLIVITFIAFDIYRRIK